MKKKKEKELQINHKSVFGQLFCSHKWHRETHKPSICVKCGKEKWTGSDICRENEAFYGCPFPEA